MDDKFYKEQQNLIQALQKQLSEQTQLMAGLRQQLTDQTQLTTSLQQQLVEQTQLISNLQQQIESLLRLLYGKKSEKRSSKASEEEDKDSNNNEKPKNNASKSTNRNGRGKIPKHIEREEVLHDLPDDEKICSCCGGDLHRIGQKKSDQLEYVPAKLIVKEHIRYKYGCHHCKTGVKIAPMPPQPIDKGLPGPGLLSEIVISKYQDALPLYRQEQRWERLGYVIPRSTQGDWVYQVAFLLKPIVDRMQHDCLRSIKIHTDDTPFYVQEKNKTHTGRIWVYVGGDGRAPPCTIYEYSKSRSQKVPQRFFKDYRGYIQADAYPGYDKLFASGEIIEVGCWAHARRKYVEVSEVRNGSEEAETAIDFIGELYGIETRAKFLPTEQKLALRHHEAKPILEKFKNWLDIQKENQLPKSPLAKAIAYTLNHWQALNNYLKNGILETDNNTAERAMKPVVIGRKNYLFAGSHQAAENTAVIYSIIETCKQLKINTFVYLKDILTKLPTTLAKNIDQLLPYNWKP